MENFLQPTLENENVKLQPLQESDFERLYKVAVDPMVWEQHPNKNRYEREVFRNYFEGAMISKAAFLMFPSGGKSLAFRRRL